VDPLTVRGFVVITALAAPVGAAGAYFALGYEGKVTPVEQVAVASVAGVVLGLMVAGVCYLVAHGRNMKTVRLSEAELHLGEAVLLQTARSLVRYRTGRPHLPLDAVGGRLVLTNQRVVFLGFRGQPGTALVSLPLNEVTAVEPCMLRTAIGEVPGGLRVVREGGEELFGFGAVFADDALRWADAITDAREQAALGPA
jgi:hypothetical protein